MKLQSNMMMFTRAAGIVYGLWFFLAPSSYFSLMLVPSEMVNELGIVYDHPRWRVGHFCGWRLVLNNNLWCSRGRKPLLLSVCCVFNYRFSILRKAYTFGSWCRCLISREALNGSLLQRQWAIFIYHLFHPLLQHIERIT